MRLKKLLLAGLLLSTTVFFAQQVENNRVISEGKLVMKTGNLRDHQVNISRSNVEIDVLKMTPNKLRANPKVNNDALPLNGDQLRQASKGAIRSQEPIVNFPGISIAESGVPGPPDPTGAVGPNHYVAAVNTSVKVFDKSGAVLAGPTQLGEFLGNGQNLGDPIVMYDQLADRFFVSQFAGSPFNGPFKLIIGVSDTPDPTGQYNVYEYELDAFPDYPHYSVWHNAYIMTTNKGQGNVVYGFERDVMVAGGANPKIVGFDLPGIVPNPAYVFSPEPANLLGTEFDAETPGYVVYFQDDGWAGVTFDHLKVWELDFDWETPANSTVSQPLSIPTAPFETTFAPFGSGDVNQPGTGQKIDMVGGVISYATNYRPFEDHNSWIITFNVDIDGNDTSGVRWVELRNDDNNDWSLFQEGTYAPADGLSRFMGSAAIDEAGNIGMGFNVASSTVKAGIRYTGRFADDPLGEMTVEETTIVDGQGVSTVTNRFGDYSHLTMDPDGTTFWHTAEYFTADNQWQTQIASFSLGTNAAKDVGVVAIASPEDGNLSATESVTVSIRNFGSEDQSDFPVALSLDGTVVATETVTGTVASGETLSYTFTATLDLSTSGQTYEVKADTNLVDDEITDNDSLTKEVRNLFANDVGVTEITSPDSQSGLTTESVEVTIRNFGYETQTSIPVEYTVDGGTAVQETFTGNLPAGEEVQYTFTATYDFSELQTYQLEAKTTLTDDEDAANDASTKEVVNTCTPAATNDCQFNGIKKFKLNAIDLVMVGSLVTQNLQMDLWDIQTGQINLRCYLM